MGYSNREQPEVTVDTDLISIFTMFLGYYSNLQKVLVYKNT